MIRWNKLAAVCAVVAASAFVAVGCGGGGGSADTNALKQIPSTAVGYVTINTDIGGKGWEQFAEIYPAFNPRFKSVTTWIDDELEKGQTFDSDVKPWLGDNAGAAILSVDNTDPGRAIAWIELKSEKKFEAFVEDRGAKQGKKVGDFATYNDAKDKMYVGVGNGVAFLAETRKQLEKTLEFDGDSMADVKGLDDVADNVDEDALIGIVVNGTGVRAQVKKAAGQAGLDATSALQLSKMTGAAVSLTAQKNGLSLSGDVSYKDLKEPLLGENVKPKMLEQMPGTSVIAVGGTEFGRQLRSALDAASKQEGDTARQLGVLTAVLGVSLDDVEEALSKQFAIALSASDTGLQGLVAGVAGAALGGGAVGIEDATKLGTTANFTMAFERGKKTSEVIDTIGQSVGTFAGGSVEAKVGDFDTRTVKVQELPITYATSDDTALITFGSSIIKTWGKGTLADNDTFTDAWKASGAPDKVSGSLWVDWPRIAPLAGMVSGEGATAGGWVGWTETDDDSASFDIFMHVDTK